MAERGEIEGFSQHMSEIQSPAQEREKEVLIYPERNESHTLPHGTEQVREWPRLTERLTAEATATTDENTQRGFGRGSPSLSSPLSPSRPSRRRDKKRGKKRARERDERERGSGEGF